MSEPLSLKRYEARVEFRHYTFAEAVDQLHREGYVVRSVTELEENTNV